MARHEMHTLTAEQSKALLAAAHGDRFEALYHIALTTGARQGEILGLRWRDVSLESASVQIQGTLARTTEGFAVAEPKTRQSGRSVLLTATTIDALRRHRVRQNEERLAVGRAWDDSWGLVFPNEIGRPVEAGNLLRRSFWPLLLKAGLPRMRFHDLRHSAATLLLSRNVHPKIVSEMLRHSQISVTLDRYSHVAPTMQRAATEAMEAMLGGSSV
jgi:integrase